VCLAAQRRVASPPFIRTSRRDGLSSAARLLASYIRALHALIKPLDPANVLKLVRPLQTTTTFGPIVERSKSSFGNQLEYTIILYPGFRSLPRHGADDRFDSTTYLKLPVSVAYDRFTIAQSSCKGTTPLGVVFGASCSDAAGLRVSRYLRSVIRKECIF
jgi:hypothetical protein